MAQKPSIPKGTRDFSPIEVSKRNYIVDTIKSKFQNFGFQPIETPSFENSATLMGKYGDEGDRLIFKILNSGDFLKKVDDTTYAKKDSLVMTPKISEKALRYDLTVPFARYVVQHQNEIDFPFKRYQIQPVWRADRPQKGRFREFYQCDADVVGSKSLFQEVDFIQLYDSVFTALNLDGTTIKMNNRKVLSGFAEVIGASDKLIDFTVALDKLDKIGEEKVKEEMLTKGISEEAISKIQPIFNVSGSFSDKIETVKSILEFSEIGMGSIGGGGRYDDLTGIFGLKDMSGVGISFGLDRIYLVLEELNKFPDTVSENTKVLFVNFGETEALYAMQAIKKLRANGVSAELYPDKKKMGKQFDYANKRNIPFVVVAGETEIANDLLALKSMKTGEQEDVSLQTLITKMS